MFDIRQPCMKFVARSRNNIFFTCSIFPAEFSRTLKNNVFTTVFGTVFSL